LWLREVLLYRASFGNTKEVARLLAAGMPDVLGRRKQAIPWLGLTHQSRAEQPEGGEGEGEGKSRDNQGREGADQRVSETVWEGGKE
jgi:hypothetical protein